MSVSRPRSGKRSTLTLELAHRAVGNGPGISTASGFNENLLGTGVCSDGVVFTCVSALTQVCYQLNSIINSENFTSLWTKASLEELWPSPHNTHIIQKLVEYLITFSLHC